jgi:WD40 repeat protein
VFLLSNNEYIEVWNIATQSKLTDLYHDNAERIERLLVDEQKNRLYTSAADHTITVWDTVENILICTLENEPTGKCLSLSCDGNRLVSRHGQGRDCIKVWDTETFECLAFQKYPARIKYFTTSGDAEVIYAGLQDSVNAIDVIHIDI